MHMPREVQSEMCASAVLVTVRGGRDDSMTTLGKWLLQCWLTVPGSLLSLKDGLGFFCLALSPI